MTEGNPDFERSWLEKFSNAIDALAGDAERCAVMEGSGALASYSPSKEIEAWSHAAMERLVGRVGEAKAREILTRCSCRYDEADLRVIRREFAAGGDIDAAMRMLRERFAAFLRENLKLDEARIADVLTRGWGPAGVRQGSTILATKIPKSEYLAAYLEEEDPAKRRAYYCHCPRVRAAAGRGERIPGVYCYCGAGFYKGIWESILQKPVRVEVLESILQGGDLCRVAIRLPAGMAPRDS
ncbi:MAG: hypothetical protein JW748_14245 [Anaerolineales bacterium]|nr:hypothetical protein [Anaerolineales bacterium]